MSPRAKTNRVNIYIPDHFKATWNKYMEILERDGSSASKEIRAYVKAQVDRRAPGNPQRPITAYDPEHEDNLERRVNDMLRILIDRARKGDRFVRREELAERLYAAGILRAQIWQKIKDLIPRLRKEGIGMIL